MKDILNFGRITRAARFSAQGLRHACQNESAFRQELALAIILIPLALWLGQSGVERALLVGSVLLVLIVELLNTAIEVAINRISTELHPLSGLAKDMGSAAVFIALMNAAFIWLLVLF
jgi:diacylglycerol kinase (ATP)